jgi:predicted DsbA family dithiol-disulfide isomerase
MLVEIWSDIVCPYCYIGKQKFRQALNRFPHRDHVDVVWKSFLLNPELKTRPGRTIVDYLSEVKGWTREQAIEINNNVAEKGRAAGIDFNFDKVIVANSFDAHRLLQFGISQGNGNAVAERLFRGYFSEGRDISDHGVLAGMGADAGLDSGEVLNMLISKDFSREVGRDVMEARQLGIRAVPCFFFNRRLVISGAQESDVFLDALQKTWDEQPRNVEEPENPVDGSVCAPEGECEE